MIIQETPTLNLQFDKAKNDSDMLSLLKSQGGTFTRGSEVVGSGDSVASYVDALGILRYAKLGHPRPNFVDGVNQGLLIEEQRTNLLLHSENFDNAYWSKSNATITPNNTTSPNGFLTADKIVENNSTSSHGISKFAVIPAGTHTLTLFAKKGERSRIAIGSASGITATAVFDLELGTVIRESEGIATGGKIKALSNGWYRCSVTLTSGSALSSGFFIVDSGTNKTYLGDGTSGIFIWGAQLE